MAPRPRIDADKSYQPGQSHRHAAGRSPHKPQSKKKHAAARPASPPQTLDQEIFDLNVTDSSLSDSSRGRRSTRPNAVPESIPNQTSGTRAPTRGRDQGVSPAHASNADSTASTSKTQDIDYFFLRADKKVPGSKSVCLKCRYVDYYSFGIVLVSFYRIVVDLLVRHIMPTLQSIPPKTSQYLNMLLRLESLGSARTWRKTISKITLISAKRRLGRSCYRTLSRPQARLQKLKKMLVTRTLNRRSPCKSFTPSSLASLSLMIRYVFLNAISCCEFYISVYSLST